MIYNISSDENPMIKHIKQLARRKYRLEYGEYMVEGVRIIRDGLENNSSIKSIVFSERLYNTSGGEGLLQDLLEKNIKIYQVPESIFLKLSDTQNPQGIIGIFSCKAYDLDAILNCEKSLFLILDRIQDPGNLGTIIRSADAAGFDAVLLTKGCVDLYNLKTIRSTMGSIFHFPIIHVGKTKDVIQHLKAETIKIVSTSLETNKYYDEVDYKGRTAFVIGNEGHGVLKEVLDLSDELVKIPMKGKAESLNAAIAASIMMYEAVRQRRNQKI
ncbi:TrmH family RNA methyltransferase [Marinisporobacter balticus]|uniref:TrmH family RNA methyltransferase n=1 Tax=Marinisporobacter balticus TaxID=2018667 RepID=A0A4R2KRN6_9FIRM|nr:RNA methyltransferase [Marinisporobacter balticus]TCO73656.1 TrmH family RNA methyltransferase [Marinisporobacter balticus]